VAVTVTSPAEDVTSGAVVAVLTEVWAWAAAAKDRGAMAAAANKRFIEFPRLTVAVLPGRFARIARRRSRRNNVSGPAAPA
jgi:hypothetical protein